MLSDFSTWLADSSDEMPPLEGAEMASCDLYTLLSEFTVLRQEIKRQNREQHNATRIQQTLLDGQKEVTELFEKNTNQLDKLEENIRNEVEKKTITPFFDIRDALRRGLTTARRAASAKGLFRRPPKDIDAIVDGFEMALRRFDRALSYANIQAIDNPGAIFDPATMQAIDRRFEQNTEPGCVLEVYLSGFIRNNEVLRTAQVVVSTPKAS